MRPLGRKEKQRRNLPCRATPAECCPERRESLSKPNHNFSIGRRLWFGPMRWPPRRRLVQPQIKCCSDRSITFACDFPLVGFFLHPREGNPDATWEHERKWFKTGCLLHEGRD